MGDASTAVARGDAVAAEVRLIGRRNAALFGSGSGLAVPSGTAARAPRTSRGRPARSGRGGRWDPAFSSIAARRRPKVLGLRPRSRHRNARLGRGAVKEILAIALNGRDRRSDDARSTRAGRTLSSLLDEELFVDGRNTVDVFAVRGGAWPSYPAPPSRWEPAMPMPSAALARTSALGRVRRVAGRPRSRCRDMSPSRPGSARNARRWPRSSTITTG